MFNAIDLFCGAGGLSCGLQKAGFNIKLGIDIDSSALSSYQNYFQNTIVISQDICNISGEEITTLTGIQPNDNFLLAGCPPCQGFSALGKRNANDPKNELVYQYIRLINELHPTFILMENVPGMSRGVGSKIFSQVVEALETNYIIAYKILNAADYGVPQMRKRLVLHGVRKDVYTLLDSNLEKPISLLPNPTHCECPTVDNPLLSPWETVEKAIMAFPPLEAGETYSGNLDIHNHQCRSLSATNIERLKYIHSQNGSRNCLPDNLVLQCHRNHKTHTDTYGVMALNRPAPTLTSGCTTISKGRYGHPTQNRGISLREAAKLQSFPDDFVFYGTLSSISLQIGNAVPPLLAQASARNILKYMDLYENLLHSKNN